VVETSLVASSEIFQPFYDPQLEKGSGTTFRGEVEWSAK